MTYTNLAKAVTDANSIGGLVEMDDGTYDCLGSRGALTKANTIFKAKNQGKAILKGAPIDIKAQGIEFSGFDIQYSISEDYIHLESTCKLLNNKIHMANLTTQKWILANDPDITIAGNEIYNKTTTDDIITVNEPGVKIQNNYIHDQTGTGTTTEAIRLGASSLRTVDFHSDVSGNTFERIKADTELITVKSCNNDIHDNIFRDNKSSPTFRHGRNNKFRNNKLENTGLRIYGKGHTVTGNNFKRDSNSQLLQIVVGNGEWAEEEQNTNAGYTQVRDLTFDNNWIDAEDSTDLVIFCWGYDAGRSLKPINNKVTNNKILGSKGILANSHDGASWNNNTISSNMLWNTGTAKLGDMPTSGYVRQDPNAVTPPPVLTIEQRVKALEDEMVIIKQKLGI